MARGYLNKGCFLRVPFMEALISLTTVIKGNRLFAQTGGRRLARILERLECLYICSAKMMPTTYPLDTLEVPEEINLL